MAWSFGDSFDLYAATADMINGYWDSGTTGGALQAAGRFTGSQAYAGVGNTGVLLAKSSGANDAVHHIVVSFRSTNTISGSTLGAYFQLVDGTTGQCCIVFRSDGVILLTSGTPAGTILDTYPNAFPVQNVWYAFEFEVVINNTTGSWAVRRNGNPSNDHALGSLNTRGGTANNYANKLQFGQSAVIGNHVIDDLFWRSDASSVAWLGDIRCYTRMPGSDVSVHFTPTSSFVPQTTFSNTTTVSCSINQAHYIPFTASTTGTIGSVTMPIGVASTANFKCCIYSSVAGVPAIVLGSATPISAPIAGNSLFTFGTPVSVTAGTAYFVGINCDANSGQYGVNAFANTGLYTSGITYASFPTNNPATLSGVNQLALIVNIAPSTSANFYFVSDVQQDAATSYVYDSTVADADFYALASSSIPAGSTVIAATTRGYMEKSDAGTRTAAVQLKSFGLGAPSTFNPSDKEAHITLSGGNLIATGTGGWTGIARAVDGQTTGKFYWEYTFAAAQIQTGVGLYASTVANTVVPSDAATGHCGVVRNLGTVYVDGTTAITVGGSSTTVQFGTIASGTVICVAVDLAAKLIWFRMGAAGLWNNLAGRDPATGVGGISIPNAAGGGIISKPIAAFGGADTITANFGATSFTGAVPSGFNAGWPALTSTTVATPTLTLTNSGFQWAWRMDLTDPNTSAAWALAAVDSVNIGPVVIS